MQARVDTRTGVPIYLQLVEQIKHLIASGELSEGDQLPTVRQMAVDLEINANTVAKAYGELERQGIIERRQGVGTFVRLRHEALTDQERSAKLFSLCTSFLSQLRQFGFEWQEALQVLQNLSTRDRR